MSVADSNEDKIPKSPFAVYRTEADSLFRSGKYTRAVKCYTQALELEPENQHCLVARSRCYLLDGQIEKALEDAETSLKQDGKYPKGLFQKAEVYYIMGEFEKALVLYHRGHRLRPEMEAFRLGIQKCEEAINNSVGDPDTIKLKLDCDLTYFFLNDESKNPKKKNDNILKKRQVQQKNNRAELKPFDSKQTTVRSLLGELYADRDFLEKLLNEEEALVKKTENSEKIRDLTVNGLNYLHRRCDFWQQQKPMYARQTNKWSRQNSAASSKQQREIIKYVVKCFDEIDIKQSNGEHKKAIKQSEGLIKQIDKWSQNDLPTRLDILANVYCLIGNSYLEMGNFEKALEYHEKDQELGEKHDLEESKYRSIDNIGRTYAKQGHFNKAIDIWLKKVPMSKSDLESTWLHHEIGRCYLELESYDEAINYGEKAVEFARAAEDDKWQMNAYILVAQASNKINLNSNAVENFEQALDFSKIMKNTAAEEAIKKAIDEVNMKIIDEERLHKQREAIQESKEEDEKRTSAEQTDKEEGIDEGHHEEVVAESNSADRETKAEEQSSPKHVEEPVAAKEEPQVEEQPESAKEEPVAEPTSEEAPTTTEDDAPANETEPLKQDN